ncbi:MAG: hypothetical protein A2W05_11265 [Candidatus Schekmanbacteria bacterium RBG_16_38_10]|uniref:Uncharacterized protein n=1 Tax=Candidatus Schekmanbacteria bacterium RBG_16_38_10 TaxID=1817879 RepID=A0A1F7S3J5_9BACT|nr:MAG: hypothetical protein A2W05_11265 [Candidatus Schekmanbacteria bacterium RBG_16_38_10]
MPPKITLQPGQQVQIQWPWLREHGSSGVVLSYEADIGLYYVKLDRTAPPYRGKYTREELVVID